MAFRQSLTRKAILLRRWYHPSSSHIVYSHRESDEELQSRSLVQSGGGASGSILSHMRNTSGICGNGRHAFLFGQSKCLSVLPNAHGFGPSSLRFMSTEVGEGSNSVEYLGDAADVLAEKTVEVVSSQASGVSEVAVAAADSAFPIAAVQHLIDGVHTFTGLNWWAAIALTTILVRGATLPFLISHLKAIHRLNLIRPRLEEIKQNWRDLDMDPIAVANGQKEIKALFERYKVGPLTPLKELLIQGPIFITFFLAIANMVEKVPSFKTGGALWFTDLTTPDTLCLFPLLAALSFLFTVEYNVQGNSMPGNMKNFSRIMAILAVPLTMGFSKALFCFWVTSNMFTLSYDLVLRHPEIRKLLDLSEASMSSSKTQSAFPSLTLNQEHKVDTEPTHSPDSSDVARRRASEAVMKQRIRHLEQQLKGRKKNEKTR